MTEVLEKARPKVAAVNGRSAGPEEWRSVPELAAAYREIELTVYADVISEMTGGPWTTNDPLAVRCASRVQHLGVFADTRLPTATIPPGADRMSSGLGDLAAALARHPRGTWQIWKAPDGYGAWASDGFGNVKCWAGHTFSQKTERNAVHDSVNAHAMLLGKIIYDLRGYARDRIVAHSIEAASVPAGTKMRDANVDGRIWTNLTYLGIVDGVHKFAVSRRGQRATLTARNDGARRILGIPVSIPEDLTSDDGHDRLTSPREIRLAKAQAEYERIAAEQGLTAMWGSKAAFTHVDEEHLERTVYGDANAPIGRIDVVFAGTRVLSSAFVPGSGIASRF